MNALAIHSTNIRQDAHGRYCLNDLHRAAGGANRHRPSLWVENKQTAALVAEMAKAGIPALESVKGGASAGTYVAKELVYAYAMWISPVFHLQVIRAYDAMAADRPDPLLAMNDPVWLRQALLSYSEKVLEFQPKAQALDRLSASAGSLCVRDAAAKLGVPERKLIASLIEHRWAYRRPGKAVLCATADAMRQGVVESKAYVQQIAGEEDRLREQFRITAKGLTRLTQQLLVPLRTPVQQSVVA